MESTTDGTPVTVLSGSLGAGKTTLLNHLLHNAGDRELAVLVNDMGDVNVDAELVAEGSDLDAGDVAELSNGCICCELQDDLETAVVGLARERTFDHLVVECSGISEPEPVARLFTTASRVAASYDLAALVTVLDTRRFLDAFAGDSVPERRGPDEDDTRPLADLLIEQLEAANLVVLNKTDLCDPAELERAEALVRALRPEADVVRTEFSAVDPAHVLDVDPFEPGQLSESEGLHHPAAGADGEEIDDYDDGDDPYAHDHRHPDEVYGVESTVYRARRPFHPDRFASFLRDGLDGVVRSKGVAWIAGRHVRIGIAQAGPAVRATARGPWIAALPEVRRDLYRDNRPDLEWHDEHGDRRTELVFIGTDVDADALRATLEECLVTDEEWDRATALENPFPDEETAEVVLREP